MLKSRNTAIWKTVTGFISMAGLARRQSAELLVGIDLEAENAALKEALKSSKGQKRQKAIKRLRVVSAFLQEQEPAGGHDPRSGTGYST